MESSEDLPYTSDTYKHNHSLLDGYQHTQGKTISVSSKRFQKFSQNKRSKKSFKVNDSICTSVEHEGVSHSLNNHNLRVSLKGIYDRDPVSQLKKIFKTRHRMTPTALSHKSKNFSFEFSGRKKSKVDSLFQHNEADFIMNELKTIKSPKVWQQVVQNFKNKPSTLMDLIPLE